jgi:predicted amidohydrolase YtcJ
MQLYADMLFRRPRLYCGTGWPIVGRGCCGARWAHPCRGQSRRTGGATRSEDGSVDLKGKLLLPGFTESHLHFIELALRASQVDITYAASAAEAIGAVRAKAEELRRAGDEVWLRGGGWNENVWTDAKPHRRLLDEVAPDMPVALDSKELHAVWANSAALRRAGINRDTADVPGGVIERDPDGEPTGVLRENAEGLLYRVIPEAGLEETVAATRGAIPGLWRTGIVAFHNANDTQDGIALRTYQELKRRGELGVRVVQQIPVVNLEAAAGIGLRSGLGDAWLRIGGIKMFADGALGSRTANMLQPYEGEPNKWGVTAMDPEEMLEHALKASAAGFSLTIHAIGDRANRDVLNILAEVRAQERRSQEVGPRATGSNTCRLSTTRICRGWRSLDVIARFSQFMRLPTC